MPRSLRKAFPFSSSVQVLVHEGLGAPYAVQVDVRKIYTFLMLLALFSGFTTLGTILFFRELEISERFEQRVLELEIHSRLMKAGVPTMPIADTTEKSAPAATTADAVAAMPETAESLPATTTVRARISGLRLTCTEVECRVNLGLVPTKPGTATGRLLVVLETEAVRIGAATHTSDGLTRYLVYPGFRNLDTLDRAELATLPGKPFRFTSALQSTVTFQIDRTVKPMAVDVFLFDDNSILVHHKRQPYAQEETTRAP